MAKSGLKFKSLARFSFHFTKGFLGLALFHLQKVRLLCHKSFWEKSNQNTVKGCLATRKVGMCGFTPWHPFILLSGILLPRHPLGELLTPTSQALEFISLPALGVGM